MLPFTGTEAESENTRFKLATGALPPTPRIKSKSTLAVWLLKDMKSWEGFGNVNPFTFKRIAVTESAIPETTATLTVSPVAGIVMPGPANSVWIVAPPGGLVSTTKAQESSLPTSVPSSLPILKVQLPFTSLVFDARYEATSIRLLATVFSRLVSLRLVSSHEKTRSKATRSPTL